MAKPKGGLTEWFGKGSKGDWVDIGAPKKYPKCVPRAKARSMSKEQITSAVRRKRAKAQGVGGKPTNVKTFKAKAGGLASKIAIGCGAIMDNRRKKTKYA